MPLLHMWALGPSPAQGHPHVGGWAEALQGQQEGRGVGPPVSGGRSTAPTGWRRGSPLRGVRQDVQQALHLTQVLFPVWGRSGPSDKAEVPALPCPALRALSPEFRAASIALRPAGSREAGLPVRQPPPYPQRPLPAPSPLFHLQPPPPPSALRVGLSRQRNHRDNTARSKALDPAGSALWLPVASLPPGGVAVVRKRTGRLRS